MMNRGSSHFHSAQPTPVGTDIEAQAGSASPAPPTKVHGLFRNKDRTMTTMEGRTQELNMHRKSYLFWLVYRALCQFRFGYLSFLVLMVIIIVSFTWLMEIFFAIFLPSAKDSDDYILRAVLLLVFLPVVMLLFSYLFQEGVRFFVDAIKKTDGSLRNFRLALVIVIHYMRHRAEINAVNLYDPSKPQLRSFNSQASTSSQANGENEKRKGGCCSFLRHIFQSQKDDPFTDEDKDEEDANFEKMRDVQQNMLPMSRTPHEGATSARSRWRRAKAAVKATLLLNKIFRQEGPPIDVTTFVLADLICPVVFELSTITSCLYRFFITWSPSSAFTAYIKTGFWCITAYLVLWIITHFWSSRNRRMRILVSNYRRRRRRLRHKVAELKDSGRTENLWLLDIGFRFYHHVGGGLLSYMADLICCRRQPRRETYRESSPDGVPVLGDPTSHVERKNPANIDERRRRGCFQVLRDWRLSWRVINPWNKLSYNWRIIILLLVVIAAALVSLVELMIGWPIMGVALIMLATVIQRRFPQVFGRTFRHFISVFVVLSIIFFLSSIVVGTFATGGNFKLGPPGNATLNEINERSNEQHVKNEGLTIDLDRQTAEYPACSLDYDGLSVVDFALIADAAYGQTPEVQQMALDNRVNGTVLANYTYVAHQAPQDHQVWMEIYFNELNMTVVSVRGTASANDALEDLHFWFGITIMQVMNVFVPFLRQLPNSFVVGLLSMKGISWIMPEPVYEPLEKHVREVKERVGDNLVVTGHSLGGSIAAIVAAKVQARAVSFSGPGLLYSRERFDLDAQSIRDNVLTFKPQTDIVPKVDLLGGMVQEIRCKHTNPMSCHSTFTHLCELYLSCGDSKMRNWSHNKQCIEYEELPEIDREDDE